MVPFLVLLPLIENGDLMEPGQSTMSLLAALGPTALQVCPEGVELHGVLTGKAMSTLSLRSVLGLFALYAAEEAWWPRDRAKW